MGKFYVLTCFMVSGSTRGRSLICVCCPSAFHGAPRTLAIEGQSSVVTAAMLCIQAGQSDAHKLLDVKERYVEGRLTGSAGAWNAMLRRWCSRATVIYEKSKKCRK
jgi:hypothetical protein